MPITKEEKKEYDRLNYLKNKEKKKETNRLYRIENKEKIKEYEQTEERKKSNRISRWKYLGILCFDFDLLYDIFLKTTHCEICNVELNTNTKTRKCFDHEHSINDRFNVRYVLCHSCNTKLG